MIAQVDKTLFVTPNEGCDICDGTGAVWIDRETNAAEDCECITRQLDEHDPAFSHYEVIAPNANETSKKIYAALKILERCAEIIVEREHQRQLFIAGVQVFKYGECAIGDEIGFDSDSAFHCEKCNGNVGHLINCPN